MKPAIVFENVDLEYKRRRKMSLKKLLAFTSNNKVSIIQKYNRDLLEYYKFTITFDEVLAYNPQITNPNLMYPGMRIAVPEIL
jgi:hypothetical protein